MSGRGDPERDEVRFVGRIPKDWMSPDPTSRRTPSSPAPQRRRRRWPIVLAAVALLAAGARLVTSDRGAPSPPPSPTGATAPLPVVVPTSSPSVRSTSTPPVRAVSLGQPLLGVTAGWELFALGDGVLLRFQFAAGVVTTTEVPPSQSGGPVWFIAAADRALIRPIDVVPGSVVPDGKPAQPMSARLSTEGPMFPGPDPAHVWVDSSERHQEFTLVALDGTPAGARIVMPPETSSLEASPDGGGYVLLPATGGIYDAHPDGLHRITTGTLLASGPTGWLASECDDTHHCITVLIDRVTGARRAVGLGRVLSGAPGQISPDGATADILTGVDKPTLSLIDLATGQERRVEVAFHQWVPRGSLVWSPDSRWLFVIDAEGRLQAVDPSTALAREPLTTLPRLQLLATRPAAVT